MSSIITLDRVSGIYQITCIPTGKFYIGSAINLGHRWAQHHRELNEKRHGNAHLQRAWNKYGSDAFCFDVLEFVPIPNLVEREQLYIDAFRPYDRSIGFNICRIAGSTLGRLPTPEARSRMSEGQRRRSHSPEVRAKIGAAQIGRRRSPETREKIRQGLLNQSVEAKRKRAETNKNRYSIPISEETRRKMSDSAKKRKRTSLSVETRQKMSEAHKLKWDAVRRAKQSELSKGRKHTIETRNKISETKRRKKEDEAAKD